MPAPRVVPVSILAFFRPCLKCQTLTGSVKQGGTNAQQPKAPASALSYRRLNNPRRCRCTGSGSGSWGGFSRLATAS